MGMPNNNLGLNSKKPYLVNHSRKISVPYLLNQKDVLLQAKFYDVLMGFASKGQVNIYFDQLHNQIIPLKAGEHPKNSLCGYFLRIKKGKEVEIQNADTIVSYNPNLVPVFNHKELLKAERDDFGSVNKKKILESLIDDIFFNKSLVQNYFTKSEDLMIRDGAIFNQLVAVRERLFSWFYKNDGVDIWPALQNAGNKLIKYSICSGYWKKARNQINLLWSLEDYFKNNQEREDIMNQVKEQFRKHINEKEEWEYSSDEEYYFAVGQLVSYFISKSNSKKKPLSLINPFLNAGSDSIIKNHLVILFKKYNFSIPYQDMRVKRLYSNAMLYLPKSPKVDSNMLSAGVTANNFIFMKSTEESEGN